MYLHGSINLGRLLDRLQYLSATGMHKVAVCYPLQSILALVNCSIALSLLPWFSTAYLVM